MRCTGGIASTTGPRGARGTITTIGTFLVIGQASSSQPISSSLAAVQHMRAMTSICASKRVDKSIYTIHAGIILSLYVLVSTNREVVRAPAAGVPPLFHL